MPRQTQKMVMQLLFDNKADAPRSNIVAADKEATIYLYDAIVATDAEAAWFGGVSAERLVKDIRALKVDTIHLRINCPGGDVFGGRAIEQALRDHPANIIAHIDGYAASAASFIMLAADEIEIASGGFIMIHNAWTICMGNAADITKTAQLLDKIDASLVKSYAERTGNKQEVIAEWMAKETWFSAQEAVDAGFADKISEGAAKAEGSSHWNLSAYENAPIQPTEKPIIKETAPAEPAPAAKENDSHDHSHLLRTLEVAIATA